MKKVSLDKLLAKGDVIRIVDTADVDSGNLFVYRGRTSGHNVLDEVGGDRNPVAVEHLPEYSKLFQLHFGVPQPESTISDEKYRAILEDLHQNSQHLGEGLELGLSPAYEEPRYEKRDFEAVDAEYKANGRTRHFDIQSSGLSLRQDVPRDGLFSRVAYQLSDSGIWVSAGISFWNLDGAFSLGFKDNNFRYRIGQMTDEEKKEQVYDKERFGEVFEELKQKGILVHEIRSDRLPYASWNADPMFDKIFNHTMWADIVTTPVEDPIRANTMYFESLGEAQKYMQGLFEQIPKLAKEHQPL
jgi:hypothetical protein